MNVNSDMESEIQIALESKFKELNTSDKDSNSVNINHHKHCYNLHYKKPWCKECVPCCIIEGWTSENTEIDEFIKDTIYNATLRDSHNNTYKYPHFLEWVPFDRFEEIKQIGEGGFAKVYCATWIDGNVRYVRQNDGNWKKKELEPMMKVALKRLNGSENMSVEFLNELKAHWGLNKSLNGSLKFYGMTKDPETKEFMMIVRLADKGNLRCFLSSNFNGILWEDKMRYLHGLTTDLKYLHKLGYCHKDFHSGNVLQFTIDNAITISFISDFGLSGSSNEQKSDDKICGVLPYIAPEVLNKKPYTLSSDIYSFGIIMTELSSGKPPFHKRKHDISLALEICNGLRPEFGKGTPEIYKKLAYRCMNAYSEHRPTANELKDILEFWYNSIRYGDNDEKLGYKGKEIKAIFKKADKEIPNISTSYEKNPDAIYTSRVFTFKNLSNPINSSITTSYINEDFQDSQLHDLEISSSLQLKDIKKT